MTKNNNSRSTPETPRSVTLAHILLVIMVVVVAVVVAVAVVVTIVMSMITVLTTINRSPSLRRHRWPRRAAARFIWGLQ